MSPTCAHAIATCPGTAGRAIGLLAIHTTSGTVTSCRRALCGSVALAGLARLCAARGPVVAHTLLALHPIANAAVAIARRAACREGWGGWVGEGEEEMRRSSIAAEPASKDRRRCDGRNHLRVFKHAHGCACLNTCCTGHVVSCCAVLCCAVLCCAVLCSAVQCCAVLCCAVLCCAVLCCAVL
jgi:hypothetical protein